MELDEVTIAAIGIFVVALVLIGAFFGWQLLVISVGIGVALGAGAAVAVEGRERLRKRAEPPSLQSGARRCPSCHKRVYESHAVCPHCFHDLKVNCPHCGAVADVGTARCPDCRHALSSESDRIPSR